MVISKISNDRDEDKSNYPCLKEYKDGSFVVLFSSERTGVVVYKTSKGVWPLGNYFATWTEDQFRVFTGTLNMSNDL